MLYGGSRRGSPRASAWSRGSAAIMDDTAEREPSVRGQLELLMHRCPRFILTGMILGAIALGTACARVPASRPDNTPPVLAPNAAMPCGQLRRWAMPPGLADTAMDRRSTDTLVTQARLNGLAAGAEYYCMLTASYPARLGDILGYQDGVISRRCAIPPDYALNAWHGRVRYELHQGVPVVTFAGPNGKFDTPDDITLPARDAPHAETIDLHKWCGAGG